MSISVTLWVCMGWGGGCFEKLDPENCLSYQGMTGGNIYNGCIPFHTVHMTLIMHFNDVLAGKWNRTVSSVVNGHRERTHREKHVFLVLVDSSGVWDRVCVLDHADRLACKRRRFCVRGGSQERRQTFKNAPFQHLPVRMDWSTRRVVDLMEMILISAGTLSPTIVHTNTEMIQEILRLI